MPEKSTPKARSACRHDGDARDACEVGRIVLGDRVFVVALASTLPVRCKREELCRFTLGDQPLAVFESLEQRRASTHHAADDIARRLSGRELEIAVLVAQGHATKNIAYRLQLSEWTVVAYVRRIFDKLGVDSRAAMVYRCAPLIERVADVHSDEDRQFGTV